MKNDLSTINGDPISRVLTTYLAGQGPRGSPRLDEDRSCRHQGGDITSDLSEVALEQRISEAAVAHGLFVVFDRRDMG